MKRGMSLRGALLLGIPAIFAFWAGVARGDGGVNELRTASVNASGASMLVVNAPAGALTVSGNPDIQKVRVNGKFQGPAGADLSLFQWNVSRRGASVHVAIRFPRRALPDSWRPVGKGEIPGEPLYAVDLEIEIPARLGVEVETVYGAVEICRVRSVRLQGELNDIRVEEVEGDVTLSAGAGECVIRKVGGDVFLEKGPGEVRVERVGGSVEVTRAPRKWTMHPAMEQGDAEYDPAGEIIITHVRGSVHVKEDGRGDIRVHNVAGDFTVDKDPDGDLAYEHIGGRVRVPRTGPPKNSGRN
ncbi:MAG: hypothetical protein JRK53_25320 [Deltaproteobacteria bacterium]|nr:hypothetical protein [Deltaproteobacteria bacterium]